MQRERKRERQRETKQASWKGRSEREQGQHISEPSINTAKVPSASNLNVGKDSERKERQLSGNASSYADLVQEQQQNRNRQPKIELLLTSTVPEATEPQTIEILDIREERRRAAKARRVQEMQSRELEQDACAHSGKAFRSGGDLICARASEEAESRQREQDRQGAYDRWRKFSFQCCKKLEC